MQQNNDNLRKAVALINYLITSNERKARALLHGAGYPSPDDPKQMQAYFMDWLKTDRTDALKQIMLAHPDKGMLDAVNEMDAKPDTDPSFPLPNRFATKSDTYFDQLSYGQYPYTPQHLANHAYPRTAAQSYRQAIITGFANYGGQEPYPTQHMSNFGGSKSPETKNLILVVLGLIVLFGVLSK